MKINEGGELELTTEKIETIIPNGYSPRHFDKSLVIQYLTWLFRSVKKISSILSEREIPKKWFRICELRVALINL